MPERRISGVAFEEILAIPGVLSYRGLSLPTPRFHGFPDLSNLSTAFPLRSTDEPLRRRPHTHPPCSGRARAMSLRAQGRGGKVQITVRTQGLTFGNHGESVAGGRKRRVKGNGPRRSPNYRRTQGLRIDSHGESGAGGRSRSGGEHADRGVQITDEPKGSESAATVNPEQVAGADGAGCFTSISIAGDCWFESRVHSVHEGPPAWRTWFCRIVRPQGTKPETTPECDGNEEAGVELSANTFSVCKSWELSERNGEGTWICRPPSSSITKYRHPVSSN